MSRQYDHASAFGTRHLAALLDNRLVNTVAWRDIVKGLTTGPDWRGWAEKRDFTFTEDMPELVGEWLPPFDGSHERYVDVVDGRWRTLEFRAFTHGTYRAPHGGVESRSTSNSYLVVRLPGGLPPDVAAMKPDDAFKLLGGKIPSGFDFSFRPPDHLFGVAIASWSPPLLEGVLENLTLQIEAAPPELWQH